METLYISDLDGTLANNDARLSEFTLKTLQSLVDDGLPFTVASARSIVSIQQMLEGLRLDLPVIAFNGGYVSDLETGHHKIVNHIDNDIAEQIFELLPADCVPYLSTYTGAEERVYHSGVHNAGMQWYHEERVQRKDPRFRESENLRGHFDEQVMCLTLINRKEALSEFEVELSEKFGNQLEVHFYENQYSPGWYWLTVHGGRSSKDQAITDLKAYCGLENSDVVVFGDNINDISMFKAADHAVAVGNATDEVKKHADEIIGSNLDDSVAKYLKALWK